MGSILLLLPTLSGPKPIFPVYAKLPQASLADDK